VERLEQLERDSFLVSKAVERLERLELAAALAVLELSNRAWCFRLGR